MFFPHIFGLFIILWHLLCLSILPLGLFLSLFIFSHCDFQNHHTTKQRSYLHILTQAWHTCNNLVTFQNCIICCAVFMWLMTDWCRLHRLLIAALCTFRHIYDCQEFQSEFCCFRLLHSSSTSESWFSTKLLKSQPNCRMQQNHRQKTALA